MRADNRFGTCRMCGKQVLWIRTKNGKNMPCDPTIHPYVTTPGGRERIVTEEGDVVCSEIVHSQHGNITGHGYISHFATCQKAGKTKKAAAG